MAGIKQFNEEEAFERILTVFWQRGFGATSMQDLAQATGILRGSLYHSYGDKQALFLLAFERYRTRFLSEARNALQPADPAQALQNFFRYTIQSMQVGVPVEGQDAAAPTRGCLTTKTATDETAMAEPIRLALRSLLDGLEKILEARLSAPDTLPRLNLPPSEAARLLMTLTRGIVVIERVYQDAARLQATAQALIDILVQP